MSPPADTPVHSPDRAQCLLCGCASDDGDYFLFSLPHAADETFVACGVCVFRTLHATTAKSNVALRRVSAALAS